MKRAGTLLLVLWSFAAMPALCAGGLIEHNCECGSESDCGHESDCADDPCATIVVRNRADCGHVDIVPAFMLYLPCFGPIDGVDLLRIRLTLEEPPSCDPPPLPFHPSDAPLLV